LVKPPKLAPSPQKSVRTRRAYFDFKFGQLHVRTAFPATGGFDEQVTLFCLHRELGSSRDFARFLPEIADVRSVYAPDLPGYGETDPSQTSSVADAADAISDLANDLRLRQIDLLGVRAGAEIALSLAAARPELVRRLVLIGIPSADRLPRVGSSVLIMRTRPESPEVLAKLKAVLPNAKFEDIADYADDVFDAQPKTLAQQIGAFLSGRP
jgi:pimeloyl-ACP methyl ester carboxylesterase